MHTINVFSSTRHLPPKILSVVPLRWQHWLSLSFMGLIAILIPTSWFFWTDSTAFHNKTNHPCAPGASGIIAVNGLHSFFAIVPITSQISFDAVKALDVAWSIVIGRGGQALLLWMSYRVYTACLLRLMESTAVPYALYVDLAFGQTMSSIWQMTKFTFQRKSAARHKVLMIWLALALVWVLGWQTVTDLMTSYASDGDAYAQIIGNSFVSFESFVQSEMAFQPMQTGKYCDYVPLITSNFSNPLQQGSISSYVELQIFLTKSTFQYMAILTI